MKKYKLGEICTIVPGYAFKAADFGKGLNYVIKIKDIMPPYIDILHSEKVETIIDKKYEIKYGDFVMAMTGATIGKIGKLQIDSESKVYINQRVCKFIPEAFCDKEYLYYKLNTQEFQQFIYNNVDSKLAQPNIGHPTIYKYELELPLLSEQRRIGQFLKAIDDKINLNRAINHNLEAMIAGIMDYRFLSNINTLPKRLVGDIALIRAGGDCPQVWSKHKTNDCQVPIYSNGTDYEGLYGYTKEPTILKRGITVAARGTIGYCVMREAGYVPIIRLLAVTPNDIGGDVYLHQIFNRLKFRKDGSIQQQLTVPSIASMEIPYPNASALKSFADQTYPIIKQMNKNKTQIEQLTKLRDELLPLLMNGQVSVNYDLAND